MIHLNELTSPFNRLTRPLARGQINMPPRLSPECQVQLCVCLSVFSFFFVTLQPHLWHMEVPRLGVESEL